jgi:LPXTG-motif cell wall-anchored protein
MDTTQIIIAVIVIAVLGGAIAIWFRRRQQP